MAVGCRRVRTFCTVSRRPAGPHAPPTQRARLRSRWRSRYGGANAGRLARKAHNAGPLDTASLTCAGGASLLPLPGLSVAGQNLSRPSVTAGQPHPSSWPVNVHAKTTLTEPARPRGWQLSEAGTREARTLRQLMLKCQELNLLIAVSTAWRRTGGSLAPVARNPVALRSGNHCIHRWTI
jgi:hypothetical protein